MAKIENQQNLMYLVLNRKPKQLMVFGLRRREESRVELSKLGPKLTYF